MKIAASLFLGFATGCHGPDGTAAASAPASVAATAPPVAAVPSASATAAPAVTPTLPPSRTPEMKFDFESDTPGEAPAGFSFGRTGQGREGTWRVRADSGSNVLAQTDADPTDYRFPVSVAGAPVARDVDLQVRCKPVSGKVDQACGLVFRYRDANNYYVTRANALEGNVRLYFVKDGKRQQIASFSGKVASGTWHDYRVVARGDHFEVHWDGAKVLDEHDKTFAEAGKIGVWTKADSITYFDALSVKTLD